MSDAAAQSKKAYSDEEVMRPAFRLVPATGRWGACRDLFMQVFDQAGNGTRTWHALPEDEWHLLASIFPARIVTYPVYTNPHAQRYLKPKHGRFHTLVYEDDRDEPLPESAEEATYEIDIRLAWRIFRDDCHFGLGLDEGLEPVWHSLASLPGVDTLVVRKRGVSEVVDNTVCLGLDQLDRFRLAFDRIARRGRELIKPTKRASVRNDLLAQLDPERFPRIVQDTQDDVLVRVRLDRSRSGNTMSRAERTSSVKVVRKQLQTLAVEAPTELLRLHAEIERVTLARMIEKYQEMLGRSTLTENHWQRFFETNIFILTMVFTRPVRLLHPQFHAKGSGLDGAGAQIGDFLLAERGQALAVVEIKKPTAPLMLNSTYRNSEVYGPAAELSGAVTQVLYQQSALQSHWLLHQSRTELKESRPDAIRCVVIAGMTPVDPAQLRSFEVFRNACKNVEIVTFDELLAKLTLLLELLTSQKDEPDDVPF